MENQNQIEIGFLKKTNERLETAIYKLGEQSSHLAELLSDSKTLIHMQEQRLSMMEKDYTTHKETIAVLRQEIVDSNRELHRRISSSEKESEEKFEKTLDKMLDRVDEIATNVDTKFASFEKLKWIIIGGSVTLGLFLGYSDGIESLLKVIKP